MTDLATNLVWRDAQTVSFQSGAFRGSVLCFSSFGSGNVFNLVACLSFIKVGSCLEQTHNLLLACSDVY